MLWLSSPKSLICKHLFTKLSQKTFMMNQWKKRSRMYELHDFYHQHIRISTILLLYFIHGNKIEWMAGLVTSHWNQQLPVLVVYSSDPKYNFPKFFLPFSSGKVGFLHDWLHLSLNQGGSTHSKVGSRDPRGLHIAIGVLDDGVLH